MFYFYVLKSLRDSDLYLGYTNNLRKRLREHNNGHVISTRNRSPLKLVYYEAYSAEEDARERERQIKRRSGALISLKRRLKGSL